MQVDLGSDKVSFALVLNRKKNGKLSVNELVMLMHRRICSAGASSSACSGTSPRASQCRSSSARRGGSDEACAALLASRAVAVQQHVCALGLHGDQAVEYLLVKGMAA